VTEHLAVELVSAARVQVALGVKLPEAAPLFRVTVPPGLDLLPESVSETVAVQVELSLIGVEAGVQLTAVAVARLVTVRAKPVALLLLAWMASLAL
jgi:hypothetical protein